MSTYEKRYDGLKGDALRGKAIQDTINYLGAEQFVNISQLLHQAYAEREFTGPDDKQFRFALMMVGVQGYPCVAWYELLFGAVQP